MLNECLALQLDLSTQLEQLDQAWAQKVNQAESAHKAELKQAAVIAEEKLLSQQRTLEQKIARIQEEHERTSRSEMNAHETAMTSQKQAYEDELREQEARLNEDSKGISELRLRLEQSHSECQELDHLYKAKSHELQVFLLLNCPLASKPCPLR